MISYDAQRSTGLHNDSNSRARGSGRSASAVPGTGANAQRGLRRLEAGDESTAIGTLYQASLAAEATLNYANSNHESCHISDRLMNQLEGYHREAVQARENACAGRPLRPFPPDIIQR
jgi:hypothetical protein